MPFSNSILEKLSLALSTITPSPTSLLLLSSLSASAGDHKVQGSHHAISLPNRSTPLIGRRTPSSSPIKGTTYLHQDSSPAGDIVIWARKKDGCSDYSVRLIT